MDEDEITWIVASGLYTENWSRPCVVGLWNNQDFLKEGIGGGRGKKGCLQSGSAAWCVVDISRPLGFIHYAESLLISAVCCLLLLDF